MFNHGWPDGGPKFQRWPSLQPALSHLRVSPILKQRRWSNIDSMLDHRLQEGHGAMVRAWRSADVAACRAVSNPAWCRIFREISCFSPLNLGTLLRCCVLGQGTSPSNASLDSGENEYLVGQRWQCVRWVQCAETAAGLYALRGVEMAHEWTGPVTRG